MADPREYKCPKDVIDKAFEAVITEACVSELLSDEDFALIQHFCSESSVSLVDFVKASLQSMSIAIAISGSDDITSAIDILLNHKSNAEEAQDERF